jgi:hypothetical protein
MASPSTASPFGTSSGTDTVGVADEESVNRNA